MNCDKTQELLSAFYDGELSADTQTAVADHLERCISCATTLTGFQQLSDSLSQAATPTLPPSVWEGVVQGLGDQAPTMIGAESVAANRPAELAPTEPATTLWSRATLWRLAIAASLLLAVGLGVWRFRGDSMPEMPHDHSQDFVATIDHYLDVLPKDPDGAEQFLLKKYNGTVIAPDEAVRLVGYQPAVAQGLPHGYSLTSTSVLKMPCCTCVKSVCRRQDGSTLVLFEHDDDQVTWFGQRATSMAVCGDKECCLVDLDSSLAATWRKGSRSVTVIGLRDQEEITELVRWFDQV